MSEVVFLKKKKLSEIYVCVFFFSPIIYERFSLKTKYFNKVLVRHVKSSFRRSGTHSKEQQLWRTQYNTGRTRKGSNEIEEKQNKRKQNNEKREKKGDLEMNRPTK